MFESKDGKMVFVARHPYEKDHDFNPQKENSGVCRVCGLSDKLPSWGRVQVWSFSGMIPGKCRLVNEAMES